MARLVILFLALSAFVFAQDIPDDNPHGRQPTTYCTPMDKPGPDGEPGCACLHNEPNGCKDGKRDVEMRNCSRWCYKQYCNCCSS